MRTVKTLALTLSFCGLVPACSLMVPVDDQAVRVEPKQKEEMALAAAAASATPSREPGSLWTDSSRWNEFYAVASGRSVGETILVKPSEAFKASIATVNGKLPSEAGTANGKESPQIMATVKEVLPHGVYVIQAKQNYRFGSKERLINLSGKVREQDISSDQTVPSDSVYEANLEVKLDPAEERRLASLEAKPSSKEDTSKMVQERSERSTPDRLEQREPLLTASER